MATGAGLAAGVPSFVRAAEGSPFKTKLLKALLAQVADDATCERIAKAGFPGVELMKKDVTPEQAAQGRAVAEKHGLKIHSFMGGWANFNNADETARRQSVEDVKRMIRLTGAYGAETILLVPCRVDGRMPKPSQFKIDFDPVTLRVKTVVEGDNAPFADYIAAQNRATELSRAAVEELVPVAVENGVTIALENVWNNLWVLPEFAAAFVKSFRHDRVKAYLDLGNNIRYAPTEQWLRALGPLTVKLHIKDFKIDREKKNDGDFVPIGKGSIDWVSVRKVIDEVGYSGWITIESGGYTDAEHSALMDRFFGGLGA
jgi:hexulose-6-phosphate isomerase